MSARELVLHYAQPGRLWVQALPIGDGRIGAMVFGGVGSERIGLNDDTFWSGSPAIMARGQQPAVEAGPAILAKIRQALAEGRMREAEQMMIGIQGGHTQSYLPIGDVEFDLELAGRRPEFSQVQDYRLALDLRTATVTTSYRVDGVRLTQEAFAVAGVVVIRVAVDVPGALGARIRLSTLLNSPGPVAAARVAGLPAQLSLNVEAPADVAPPHVQVPIPVVDGDASRGGMQAAIVLHAHSDGSVVPGDDGSLLVSDAGEVILVIATRTEYDDVSGGLSPGRDCVTEAATRALPVLAHGFDTVAAAHRAAHHELFGRVELDLGSTDEVEALPTDQRLLRRAAGTRDPGLEALLYQFGRYLLISSSRPGSSPANLQGIWNNLPQPPWSCDFTTNINVEMNYWPAETTALPECHQPFLDFIGRLAVNGQETARAWYGLDGWVTHHNTDLWRWSAPVGDGEGAVCWANWALGGAWLSRHLWEHYLFTQDEEFLREHGWPVLRGAAEFCLGWLVELPDGTLGTSPSTSPENEFVGPDGRPAGVEASVTMDRALIGSLFDVLGSAASILGVNDPLVSQVSAARARIPGPALGSRGQILEWSHELTEVDPHHRHLSHLYDLFPGNAITLRGTPELAAGVRQSLIERGDEGTGWSLAWKVCLWARLGDGDHALDLVQRMLTLTEELGTEYHEGAGAGVYPNLFCAHPPFQIDGNFGVTAGMTELLLQSHDGYIDLLPALPAAWAPSGLVHGLRARGAVSVDLSWVDGVLIEARLTADADCVVEVRHGDAVAKLALAGGEAQDVRFGR